MKTRVQLLQKVVAFASGLHERLGAASEVSLPNDDGALMLIVDAVMDGLDTNEHQLLPVRVAEEVVVAK